MRAPAEDPPNVQLLKSYVWRRSSAEDVAVAGVDGGVDARPEPAASRLEHATPLLLGRASVVLHQGRREAAAERRGQTTRHGVVNLLGHAGTGTDVGVGFREGLQQTHRDESRSQLGSVRERLFL